jgi:hypothetical protein
VALKYQDKTKTLLKDFFTSIFFAETILVPKVSRFSTQIVTCDMVSLYSKSLFSSQER